jgi:hypothetical protein
VLGRKKRKPSLGMGGLVLCVSYHSSASCVCVYVLCVSYRSSALCVYVYVCVISQQCFVCVCMCVRVSYHSRGRSGSMVPQEKEREHGPLSAAAHRGGQCIARGTGEPCV